MLPYRACSEDYKVATTGTCECAGGLGICPLPIFWGEKSKLKTRKIYQVLIIKIKSI
jgi:hypothetical protein